MLTGNRFNLGKTRKDSSSESNSHPHTFQCIVYESQELLGCIEAIETKNEIFQNWPTWSM